MDAKKHDDADSIMAAHVMNLALVLPGGKNTKEWHEVCEKVKGNLEEVQEARDIPFNLAQLADPNQAAIPEDVLDLAKVIKSARFYFWDNVANCPEAPKVWPRGKNIPIALFSKELCSKMRFQHYGHCSVVAGFFWAFGQALQNPAWKDKVEGFECLCVNASADYKLVSNQAEVNILAFNAVEENEESRENDGFTGARRALLIAFGVKSVLKEKMKGKAGKGKWTFEEVQVWLKKNIRFHDEKSIPSVHTCRGLYSIVTGFMQNQRAFAAYREAAQLYGRSTLFDDYSKLLIMKNRSRSTEDLAFIAEWLLVDMKANAQPPKMPDNPSQRALNQQGSPITVAQVTRDALMFLLQENVPLNWLPFAELTKLLVQPRHLLEMFPPGGQTPETTVELLTACPSSLKQAAFLSSRIVNASESNPWRQKVCAVLKQKRTFSVSAIELHEMIQQVFEDDWVSFQGARNMDADEKIKKAKSESREDDTQKNKAEEGETAGKTAGEQEELAAGTRNNRVSRTDARAIAKKKAQDVYANPGVVILTPGNWETDTLEKLMRAQLVHADQGAFVGFFFAGSDGEACVHPGQNKCLRETPLKKARLSSFCHGLNCIMVECRDVVVIGAGRVDGNEQIVEQVVADMKWGYQTIGVVTAREAYDDFILSGSPRKRRRLKRGFATTKYAQNFFICWKISRHKRHSHLRITRGVRQFVDKGSPISSDMMMDCPQVELNEIYAVSVEDKKEALGQSGQEEAQKNVAALNTPPQNLTSSPIKDAADQDLTSSPTKEAYIYDQGGGQEGTVRVWISKMGHWATLWHHFSMLLANASHDILLHMGRYLLCHLLGW
jgi:hypothetical protein